MSEHRDRTCAAARTALLIVDPVLSVYENGPSVKSIVGRNPLSGVFGLVASGQTPLEDPTGGLTIAEIPTGRSDDASRRGSRIAWEEPPPGPRGRAAVPAARPCRC